MVENLSESSQVAGDRSCRIKLPLKTAVQERPEDWGPFAHVLAIGTVLPCGQWPKRVQVVELQTECLLGPGRHPAYAVTGTDADTD